MNPPIKGLQSQLNYFQPGVPPLAMSNIRLGPGKYSLGVDSTVPFISLEGGGTSQKIFTWGEMIEVPQGHMVTVKNQSYMKGDIQLNTGWDYGAIPPKISLPVNTHDVIISPGVFSITPDFPADTRRCRKAFLAVSLVIGAGGTLNVFGKAQKHSYSSNNLSLGYNNIINLTPATSYTYFPLGYGIDLFDIHAPMALTDQATFILNASIVSKQEPFFYVLEY